MQLPSPPQQTHILIHSFNKYTFIRSCVCQALCWPRGGQGREVNEAVAEASGKVEALRTRTPLPPSLGFPSRQLPLLLAPVATSVTSPVDMHSFLRDQHGLSILCSRVFLHIFCCIYSLDLKPRVFTEHLLWASSVLGAGATVAGRGHWTLSAGSSRSDGGGSQTQIQLPSQKMYCHAEKGIWWEDRERRRP